MLCFSSTFKKKKRDNTDKFDKFGHYNRDKKCSYRYIPIDEMRMHIACDI